MRNSFPRQFQCCLPTLTISAFTSTPLQLTRARVHPYLATTEGNYGELSLDETLAMLDATEPNDGQIELLIGEWKRLLAYLGTW